MSWLSNVPPRSSGLTWESGMAAGRKRKQMRHVEPQSWVGKTVFYQDSRCVCRHVFCSCCSCPSPCRWSTSAAFIAHSLDKCFKCTSILSKRCSRVMLRIPGLISSCLQRPYNISSHEQLQNVLWRVRRQEEGVHGVASREWSAEAEFWISHNLTI